MELNWCSSKAIKGGAHFVARYKLQSRDAPRICFPFVIGRRRIVMQSVGLRVMLRLTIAATRLPPMMDGSGSSSPRGHLFLSLSHSLGCPFFLLYGNQKWNLKEIIKKSSRCLIQNTYKSSFVGNGGAVSAVSLNIFKNQYTKETFF